MTFAQIKRQVDALCRKYAAELAIYRARTLALELCDRMADSVTPGMPRKPMQCSDWALLLFRRLRERGVRVKSWFRLSAYLEDCLDRLLLPQVNNVLRALFPEAAKRGLIPRSRIEIPFRHRRNWKPRAGYFAAALADAASAKEARARPFYL